MRSKNGSIELKRESSGIPGLIYKLDCDSYQFLRDLLADQLRLNPGMKSHVEETPLNQAARSEAPQGSMMTIVLLLAHVQPFTTRKGCSDGDLNPGHCLERVSKSVGTLSVIAPPGQLDSLGFRPVWPSLRRLRP